VFLEICIGLMIFCESKEFKEEYEKGKRDGERWEKVVKRGGLNEDQGARFVRK